MAEKKERLYYLDVLRVLAMIPVVVCHYTRALEQYGIKFYNKILPDWIMGTYLGDFGVIIFFVVSGAALMYTYEGKLDIKRYIKKRALGILPMFYLTWFFATMWKFWTSNRYYVHDIPLYRFIYTIFGIDGYMYFYGKNFSIVGEWFLGCLIFLYILFPLIKFGIEKKPVITAAIIMVLYVLVLIFYKGQIPINNFVLTRVPEFAFGMYFVKFGKNIKWPAGAVSVLLLVLLSVNNIVEIPMPITNTMLGVLVPLAVFTFCKYVNYKPLFRLCRFIGKYSYAVFLCHHLVIIDTMNGFRSRNISVMENYWLFIICVVKIAVVTYLLTKLNDNIIKLFKSIFAKEQEVVKE